MKTETKTKENLLKAILEKLFPNNPNIVALILFAVRLFGYGILSKIGLEFLCPFIGC
jgi:hypothetical protein